MNDRQQKRNPDPDNGPMARFTLLGMPFKILLLGAAPMIPISAATILESATAPQPDFWRIAVLSIFIFAIIVLWKPVLTSSGWEVEA